MEQPENSLTTESIDSQSEVGSPVPFNWTYLALALILLLGAVFRFTGVNWDDYQHLHPDERFLTMVETAIRFPGSQDIEGAPPPGCTQWGGYFDTNCSPLNPYNRSFGTFVYGTFPLFLTKFVGDVIGKASYDEIHLVGRYLSGLFDLLSVVVIFLIGRRLYGARVGLLAALFLSASVLDIQQSHFFTVDTFANLPLLLAFWFTLDIADGRGGWRSFALAGAFFGLSLAARINLALFAGIVALAGAMRLLRLLKDIRITRAVPALPVAARAFGFAAEGLAESSDGSLVFESEPPAIRSRVINLGPLSIEVESRRRVRATDVAASANEIETEQSWTTLLFNTFVGLALAAFASIVVFRIAQPYAFTGLFGLNPKFLADINYARDLIAGQLDIPPMHQWTDRVAYYFPWINMVLWGLGPALGITGWLGFMLAAVEMVRTRKWEHLLAFFWVGGMFLYMGRQVALTDRYFLPLYPFLALFAAYFLVWLWDQVSRRLQVANLNSTAFRNLLPRVAVAIVILITVGTTLFWAAAFTSIYTRPVSRVDASRWIYANIPPGTVLGNEHWDDPLPLRVDNKDGFGGIYKGVELQMYNEDTPEKRDLMVQWLDQVDYINETSNRLYLSIPRLPLRYPLTTKYYEWLFDGKLGFQLVKTVTSRPQFLGIEINDDDAEESFTVYDHPKVLIFKKTAQYSHDNTVALLNSVDLSQVIRQKPLDYTDSHNAYQLSASDLASDSAGGTWADIFNTDDFINQIPVIAWLALLEVLGLVGLPFVIAVFPGFADRGYAFSKPLTILALGWGAWTLASYHLVPFGRENILLVLLGLLVAAAIVAWRQWRGLAAFLRTRWKILLAEEIVFLAFFFLSLLIRFGNPDLWHPNYGGEKPMDFAYLNAIIKTTWFPAYNPWFEGGYINYYYFGQVLSATLVRLTGIVPEVAYNLLLPMFFGMTALAAFAVGFNLVHAAIERHADDATTSTSMRQKVWRPFAAGLLAAIFVLIIGNVGEVGVLGSALMKLGQQSNGSLNGAGALIAGLRLWLVERKTFPIGTGDWYWTATRVIPDTINEFPFFTFLYADLHAHLMALVYTLVALGLALHAVIDRARLRWFDLGVIALVLGALRATNTWDYPTYLAIIGAALGIGYVAIARRADESEPNLAERWERYLMLALLAFIQIILLVVPSNVLGVKVTIDVAIYVLILAFALVLGWMTLGWSLDPLRLGISVGWRFIAIIALSMLFYWPFLANYGTAYTDIELWKDKRSTLQDFLVVHGIFLFIIATYLILEFFQKRTRALAVIRAAEVSETGDALEAMPGEIFIYLIPALVLELAFIVLNLMPFAVVFPLAVLALALILRREATPLQRLIALLMVAGLLMTLMVEVITLKGDIGRMNTVFKFYLQAWVLFSIAGAAGLVLMFDHLAPVALVEPGPANVAEPAPPARVSGWKQAWWGIFAVLIFAGLLYPIFATWAKVNDRYVPQSPPGLNGMLYMRDATYGENNHEIQLGGDLDAIRWLRSKNIKGSPVIAEANTGLYRWGDRISIYTGLPTIIGWDWHTKQQYSLLPGEVIDHRLEDVRTLYNTPDPTMAIEILRRYHVAYVYVGALERAVYESAGLSKFEVMASAGALTRVYAQGDVQIYQVNAAPSALAR